MSAIAGVFHRIGQPDAAATASNALRPLAWRASGVARVLAGGAAALGSIGSGPHRDVQGFAVVFDGRIDNASDLAQTLGVHRPAGACAEALILEAYRRWGAGCAARLLGDFAFIVWDPVERRLVAARDVAGDKPLYYRPTDAPRKGLGVGGRLRREASLPLPVHCLGTGPAAVRRRGAPRGP